MQRDASVSDRERREQDMAARCGPAANGDAYGHLIGWQVADERRAILRDDRERVRQVRCGEPVEYAAPAYLEGCFLGDPEPLAEIDR